MRVRNRARWALVIVAAAALVLAATAAARTHSEAKGPIIIGWAHDSTGPMAPFDGPALAAAQLEVAKINKKGVMGRKLEIKTCDTQGDKGRPRRLVQTSWSARARRSSSRRATSISLPPSSRWRSRLTC